MARNREVKSRNPIARVVRRIRHQVVPDKRRKMLEEETDKVIERCMEHDHYESEFELTREEVSYLLRNGEERRIAQHVFEGPERRAGMRDE